MSEMNPLYAESYAEILRSQPRDQADTDLVIRLRHHGIEIRGRTVSFPSRKGRIDPKIAVAVGEFLEDTHKIGQSKPSAETIRRDLTALCNKLTHVTYPTGPAPVRSARGHPPKDGPSAAIGATGASLLQSSPPLVASEAGGKSSAPAPPALSDAATVQSLSKPAPEPSVAVPQAPVPAKWEVHEPKGPWSPELLQPLLGFEVNYENHYQREAEASPGWHIVAATRRGRMHAHQASHREDAFLFASEKDFTVVCVCDGAGAYQFSRVGSESTCRKVVGELTAALKSQLDELQKLPPAELNQKLQSAIGAGVQSACDFLHQLAAKTDAKPKDFRCTLVLGILWLAGETPLLVFSQVGDGFAAGLKKDGEVQRYGKSDSGDFSGEVNCFIPDADAVRHAQEVHAIGATEAEAFIFCTDGIEDPFYPIEKKSQVIFQQLREGVTEKLAGFEKQEPHGPVIGAPDAATRLATWLDFEKRGENDDRTIVVLHRVAATLPIGAP